MKFLFLFIALVFSTSVWAHDTDTKDTNKDKNQTTTSHRGRTDKCGCHYNRRTGEYHCHTRKKRGGDCPK